MALPQRADRRATELARAHGTPAHANVNLSYISASSGDSVSSSSAAENASPTSATETQRDTTRADIMTTTSAGPLLVLEAGSARSSRSVRRMPWRSDALETTLPRCSVTSRSEERSTADVVVLSINSRTNYTQRQLS
jgi:hypothetical protein